ncbi:MAG: hypothetical protein COB36_11955 [Alphaproteobacteria bacterium]|nr:MAG: hypothetical protein COB36_11955 [Alphaproteobacteria bacterium]
MEVSALSDKELNRAMIWLHPRINPWIWVDTGDEIWAGPRSATNPHWSYLLNWNLTGPLMVEYEISLNRMGGEYCAATDGTKPGDFGHGTMMENCQSSENPLRAICECILMIEMATE